MMSFPRLRERLLQGRSTPYPSISQKSGFCAAEDIVFKRGLFACTFPGSSGAEIVKAANVGMLT
jgi:hypothetical protein